MNEREFQKKQVERSLAETKLSQEPQRASESPMVQPIEKTQFMVTSEIDAAILDRLKSQPQTLEEIDLKVVEKPQDGKHQLSLPDELEPHTKRYAFCWIFKRKQAIDEALDNLQWVFVRRSYFPDLPDHIFSARGIVERGDNVLMFRTHEVDKAMREAPGFHSNQAIKNRVGAHKGDARYYVPDSEYERQPDGSLKEIPMIGL